MVVRCGARVELGVCVRMFLSPLHSYWWASIKEIKRISSLNFTRKKTIVCQFLFSFILSAAEPFRRRRLYIWFCHRHFSFLFCLDFLLLSFIVPVFCSFHLLFPVSPVSSSLSLSALPAFVLLTIFNSLYLLLFSQGFLPVFVLLLVCDYFFYFVHPFSLTDFVPESEYNLKVYMCNCLFSNLIYFVEIFRSLLFYFVKLKLISIELYVLVLISVLLYR